MMECIIERDVLVKLLGRVQGVVERRSNMPILANVLIDVTNGQMTVTATDLELSLRAVAPVDMITPGSITIGANSLFNIVKELPSKPVRLTAKRERLNVTCEQSKFDLGGLPSNQFPAIPQPDDDFRMILPLGLLAEMLENTHFAMSSDETRYVLNGVHMQFMAADADGLPGSCRTVATDTHRLAMTEKAMDFVPGSKDFILPRKAVAEIRKILAEDNELMDIVVGPTYVQFIKSNLALISKVIQGRFPDWRRIVPTDNTLKLTVPRNDLLQVVKRMSALSPGKDSGLRLTINTGRMVIISVNASQEEAREEMGVVFDGDSAITVGFNAAYLREMLSVMAGKEVVFNFKDDEHPVLVCDPANQDSTFILMPMRV